ncbi:MAG: hypothetical protein ABSF53_11775 [Terracidiphilus sp.]
MAESPESPELNPTPDQQPSAPAPPPFQPVASSYQATGMPPQPAAAAPASGGSSAVKIILIILGIFAFFVLLVVAGLMYGCYKVRKAFHTDARTGETTITTPGGAFTSNPVKTYTADELGIDIYPGAQPSKGGLNMTLPTGSMVSANFLTSDSKDQVVAFYKGKVGSNAATMDTADGAYINWNKSTKESVVVTVTQKAGQHDGKTQIVIMHTTKAP